MLQTKTKPGFYDDKDYWIVSYMDCRSDNKDEWHLVQLRYTDVDNAYEDYCWYRKQWWTMKCTYEHFRE